MSAVLVTGVTGFIGSHLAGELARRGHRVVGSTSGEAGLRAAIFGVERTTVLRLGDAIDPAALRGLDAVVHCAWDLRPDTHEANVGGTRRLAEAARAAGATHQLFISSYSAHPGAVTEYGRSKLAAQQYMIAQGHAAARLGVVIGAGGIYRRMCQMLGRHRLVPLLDGGRERVPIIAIADLTHALVTIIERRLQGVFNLFNPDLVPLRDVLLEIRAAGRSRALFVPVPSRLVLAPLWLAERLGIRLPLDADNVRALRANRDLQDRSDLASFVTRPMTLGEMVRAATIAGEGPEARLATGHGR